MPDTVEENTRFITVWILNDPEYYDDAIAAAEQGPDQLKEFVIEALDNAPKDTEAWYTGREMTPSDYERTDWADIVDTLTG